MTTQGCKSNLDHYISILEDTGATSDALYDASYTYASNCTLENEMITIVNKRGTK